MSYLNFLRLFIFVAVNESAIYSSGLQKKLNKLAYTYQARFIDQASNIIAGFEATGQLQDSLRSTVVEASDTSTPVITVSYDDHGEFLTKKKLLFVRQPDIDNLVDYLNTKPVPKKIPGYKGDAPNLTDTQKRKRVAFAIAVKKRKNDTHKRKRWKKDALSDLLKELNTDIIEAYTNEVQHLIAQELSN